MPIRVIRDYGSYEEPAEGPARQAIVIERETTATEPIDAVPAGGSKQEMEETPGVTSWGLVSCQCTLTGGSYQLAFRREGKAFVLKSVDPVAGKGSQREMSGIEGPFNWDAFVCPECSITWGKGADAEPPFPVIKCTCGTLFCTRKGVRRGTSAKGKGQGQESWFWHCPQCGINQEISRTLDSFSGQVLKGK